MKYLTLVRYWSIDFSNTFEIYESSYFVHIFNPFKEKISCYLYVTKDTQNNTTYLKFWHILSDLYGFEIWNFSAVIVCLSAWVMRVCPYQVFRILATFHWIFNILPKLKEVCACQYENLSLVFVFHRIFKLYLIIVLGNKTSYEGFYVCTQKYTILLFVSITHSNVLKKTNVV